MPDYTRLYPNIPIIPRFNRLYRIIPGCSNFSATLQQRCLEIAIVTFLQRYCNAATRLLESCFVGLQQPCGNRQTALRQRCSNIATTLLHRDVFVGFTLLYPLIPSYAIIPSYTQLYPIYLINELYPIMPDDTRSYPIMPEYIWSYRIMPDHTRLY